jgi:curved DNA-binding protein CbpA
VPTGIRVSADYYALLGVDSSVSGDDLARAFRSRAKEIHPDTSDDPDAARKFSDLVAAYSVLSNHRTRREYDDSRGPRTVSAARVSPAGAPGAYDRPVARVAKPAPKQWTRRRAWTALVAGAVVALVGFGAAALTWQLHQSDARRHARFFPVDATRVANGEIMFVARDGKVIRTREPQQHGEGNGLGPSVRVRYDPADPTHVIVDASTLGRDITLAVVALKFVIGGLVFVVLGTHRLRRMPRAPTTR